MIRTEAQPLPALPLWLATLIALGTEAAVVVGLSNWPSRPVTPPGMDAIEVSLVSASALADSAAAGAEEETPSPPVAPEPPPVPEPEPEPEPEPPEPPVEETPDPVPSPLSVPEPAPEQVAVAPPKPKPTPKPEKKPKPKPKPKPQAKPKPKAKPQARPASSRAQATRQASSKAGHAGGSRSGKGGAAAGASSPAAYLNNPAPGYPGSARRQRQEGTVHLRVLVNAKGRPGEVRIATSSGVSSLDQAALRAVRRWRFKPAQRNGQPISAWVRIPIRFRLNQ
ncbi:energy transducer TonB [Imhoffiella purpurea]|uniref:Protein TonB n=1 Tax=Imhoffiella purpurea TaxID=1249627 RepID=W9VD74_9GAMM|nr:energy transducer TonB [Imhoffiella purpurea]EXJ14931.1 Ferric siderophore transport system, periplasmic binding protein TonB [Imhoffiella purpurea]